LDFKISAIQPKNANSRLFGHRRAALDFGFVTPRCGIKRLQIRRNDSLGNS
jgi:hypothetical protein